MPVEVLVMCAQCGRPQKAGSRCVACGAALPETPPRNEAVSSERFEGDLGEGRKLLLSESRLEWTTPKGGYASELGSLRNVSLARRPPYLVLIFSVLAAVLAAFVGFWPRVALAVLFMLGALVCLLQRRYLLVLERRDERVVRIALGVARLRSEKAERMESVYQSLAEALRARGVEVSG